METFNDNVVAFRNNKKVTFANDGTPIITLKKGYSFKPLQTRVINTHVSVRLPREYVLWIMATAGLAERGFIILGHNFDESSGLFITIKNLANRSNVALKNSKVLLSFLKPCTPQIELLPKRDLLAMTAKDNLSNTGQVQAEQAALLQGAKPDQEPAKEIENNIEPGTSEDRKSGAIEDCEDHTADTGLLKDDNVESETDAAILKTPVIKESTN